MSATRQAHGALPDLLGSMRPLRGGVPGHAGSDSRLTQAHDHAAPAREHAPIDHDKHAGHSVQMFRDKFWVTLALTVPTLVWGHMLQMALGYTAPHFPGAQWIPPL